MAQTMMQKIYSKMTPKQKNSPEIKAWAKGRKKASGRPHLAKNTREPGGYSKGGSVRDRLSKGGPVAKPN